jgi:hypothetical protein
MPSKRTLRKDKPAEVIKRLERLMEHIRRDEALMKKMREEWYREYIKDTGVKELFKQYGEAAFTREDITDERFDDWEIEAQIDYIKNDLGKNQS